jgi:hypothetical protein
MLGVGRGTNDPNPEKIYCYETMEEAKTHTTGLLRQSRGSMENIKISLLCRESNTDFFVDCWKDETIMKCVHSSVGIAPVGLIHTFPSYVFRIRFNIIFPSMSRSCKWSLSFRLSYRTLYTLFTSTYLNK